MLTEGSSITDDYTAPTSATDIKKAKGAGAGMQKALEDGFTKMFEHLSSNSLQSLLVTVLGIEFCLRLNETSRKLDEQDVLEIVPAQYKKHSGEIDALG